ncbi:hypothetical protein Taro_051971, partial [Colocasia esculenta]|nr:hypothetical protein [Colocasia esculenta]
MRVARMEMFAFDIYRMVGKEKTHETITNVPYLVPKVPHNDVDCGYFVLFFIKLILTQVYVPFSLDLYPDFL